MVTKTNLLIVVSTVQELKRKSARQVLYKCHYKSQYFLVVMYSLLIIQTLPKMHLSWLPISREYFTTNFVTLQSSLGLKTVLSQKYVMWKNVKCTWKRLSISAEISSGTLWPLLEDATHLSRDSPLISFGNL